MSCFSLAIFKSVSKHFLMCLSVKMLSYLEFFELLRNVIIFTKLGTFSAIISLYIFLPFSVLSFLEFHYTYIDIFNSVPQVSGFLTFSPIFFFPIQTGQSQLNYLQVLLFSSAYSNLMVFHSSYFTFKLLKFYLIHFYDFWLLAKFFFLIFSFQKLTYCAP